MQKIAAPETWLLLENYEKSVNLGVFHSEHEMVQKIRFDIALNVHNQIPQTDQDIDQILSYDMIIQAIEDTLKARRYALLERMADDIVNVLFQYKNAQCVKITIRKLERLETGKLGIELTRYKDENHSANAQDRPEIPRLILLKNAENAPPFQKGDVVMLNMGLNAQGLNAKKQGFYQLCQLSWALAEGLNWPIVESFTEAEAMIAAHENFVICPFYDAQQYILNDEIFDDNRLKNWVLSRFHAKEILEI